MARKRLRKWLLPVLTLLLVVAISCVLYYYFGRDPARLEQLKDHAYWGAFLISLIGNGTVILPAAVLPILAAIGMLIYPATGWWGPVAIGMAGGVGAAIGELTGYLAGYSGRGLLERSAMYPRVECWVGRWGSLTIFLLALFPFFFDLVGIAAGVIRFPLWKFLLLSWLGRTLLYCSLVLAAAIVGRNFILPYFG